MRDFTACIIHSLHRKKHAAVVKELDLKRTQFLWETNKLREAETKLHHSQREQAKLRLDHNKLQLRLQEAKDQLQQGKAWLSWCAIIRGVMVTCS